MQKVTAAPMIIRMTRPGMPIASPIFAPVLNPEGADAVIVVIAPVFVANSLVVIVPVSAARSEVSEVSLAISRDWSEATCGTMVRSLDSWPSNHLKTSSGTELSHGAY